MQVLDFRRYDSRFLIELWQQSGTGNTVLAAGITGGDDIFTDHIDDPVTRLGRRCPDLSQAGGRCGRHRACRRDRTIHIDVVPGLDDVAGKFQHRLSGAPGLPADPGHAIVPVSGLDGVLGGYRIITTNAHLELPVIAFGQRDEIGIGILALGDLGLHLLTGLGRQLHGLLGLQQRILEHVVEARIGALQDQRRECGNRGTGRGRHGVHHVVDAGTDIVQRIGHGGHGVEFAAAITQPQLRRAAQGNGYHRRIGRR